jgi:hypothetical protein
MVLVDPTSGDAWMGLAGLVDGLVGFFCFFILLTEAGIQNASEKGPINRVAPQPLLVGGFVEAETVVQLPYKSDL